MKCMVCGQPVPPELEDVGLCGPCTTGEADYDQPDAALPVDRPEKEKCPHCGKMTRGLSQHIQAKHATKAADAGEGVGNG